ncbi:hypothetical protein [Deinococcus ruber]|nr:hypothetical protein [Deinococcus ruber]
MGELLEVERDGETERTGLSGRRHLEALTGTATVWRAGAFPGIHRPAGGRLHLS